MPSVHRASSWSAHSFNHGIAKSIITCDIFSEFGSSTSTSVNSAPGAFFRRLSKMLLASAGLRRNFRNSSFIGRRKLMP
jgi:hypothetical protein